MQRAILAAILSCVCLSNTSVMGQEVAQQSQQQPETITTPDWSKLRVSQEGMTQLAPGPALVQALKRAAMFASVQPTQQRITLTHAGYVPHASEVQTQMVIRAMPSIDGKPAAFRVDAGNLILSLTPSSAGGHALVAVNTLNTDLYFQHEISETDDLWSRVQAAVPPLSLPTLAWAMQGEAKFARWQQQLSAEQQAATGGRIVTSMPLVGTTTWQGVTPDGSLIVGNNCVLRVDRATGQPLAIQFDVSQAPIAGAGPLDAVQAGEAQTRGPWLLVQVEFLTPPVVTSDAVMQWQPALAARTRVASLTELVAKPAEISVGSQVPVLALLDGELRGWRGLDEMLEAARVEAGSAKAERQRSCIVVLFQPSDEAATARAREAALAAEAVQRTFNLRVLSGRPLAPNVLVASAAALELEEMKADRVKQIVQNWQQTGTAKKGSTAVVASPIVFSSGGKQLLSRFAPRSKAVVAVIAGDGTLMRAIPLDERVVEREALSRELMGLIRDDGEADLK